MLATPDSFRPNQSPLGAIHLPQAPTIVRHTPLPEGFSVVAGEVDLSSALADSRSISFVLTDPAPILWAKLLCFRVANAIATWRQAKVCLRPLSFFGKDRASRPPPLQHRVPHTSNASGCLRRHLCVRWFFRIAPGPFQTRSGGSSGANAFEPSRFSLTAPGHTYEPL